MRGAGRPTGAGAATWARWATWPLAARRTGSTSGPVIPRRPGRAGTAGGARATTRRRAAPRGRTAAPAGSGTQLVLLFLFAPAPCGTGRSTRSTGSLGGAGTAPGARLSGTGPARRRATGSATLRRRLALSPPRSGTRARRGGATIWPGGISGHWGSLGGQGWPPSRRGRYRYGGIRAAAGCSGPRTTKSPSSELEGDLVIRNPGGDLLSQGASPQVPSARAGLTAVFGMGTGVSPPPWPPETVRSTWSAAH